MFDRLEAEAIALDAVARREAVEAGRPAPRRKTTVERAAANVLAAEFDRRDRDAAKLRAWRRTKKDAAFLGVTPEAMAATKGYDPLAAPDPTDEDEDE